MPSHCLPTKLLTSTPSSSSSSSSCSTFASAAPITSPCTLGRPSPTLCRLHLWPLRSPGSVSPGASPLRASSRGVSSGGGMGDQAVSYLSQKDAAVIDEILMGPLGDFSVEQLMEFVGLSVATSIAEITGSLSDRRA
ncbi:uncharacterized protein [Elaeis guineensis]|uniref:uncharacterized protein n=1 Tax=Elaeis guineensis var. tenera TaxID=51953 RepID=UPI000579F44A